MIYFNENGTQEFKADNILKMTDIKNMTDIKKYQFKKSWKRCF